VSQTCVRETSAFLHEDEVAQRWWALPAGCLLPLSNGGAYQLLFAGRPGSSAGPDVRDAVFYVPSTGMRVVGDVEFHVRSRDWDSHHHQTDPRYNNVILHVVLLCNDPLPTLRQNGTLVPICSLSDLPFSTVLPLIANPLQEKWPCHTVMQQLTAEERLALFIRAGLLRFEQKTHAFVEHLRAIASSHTYDPCLIPALAEGLGYGRDRDFFRAAGLYLVGYISNVREPLGRAPQPSPLDDGRLRVLRRLVEEWRNPGVWEILRSLLLPDLPCTNEQILQALRGALGNLGLSLARTDILLCNVVLPFAAAVALIEHHTLLGQRAEELYLLHPGLPSNRITRMMSTQLRLTTEPRGSCQQQGLHYIYQQTCQAKHCDRCIAGRNVL
jgi:uncharacterized protein DUF2851